MYGPAYGRVPDGVLLSTLRLWRALVRSFMRRHGATKFQLIRYIDLPSILPTATILLIMNCGSILSIGFEKAYLLQNSLNGSVSEIISTYVYKVGLVNNDMSYSKAIGLFNTVVNLVLLIIVNKASDKMSGNSLW